jgi:thiol-disulfide isomerase/thioredoxin
MPILSDRDKQKVQSMLSGMINPVKLVFFTQTIGCETCAPTRQILDELVPLNEKLSVEEVNYVLDAERAARYDVDHVPAIAMEGTGGASGAEAPGAKAARIRFYGIPSGYEFMSLLDAIMLVSSGDPGLSEASQARLATVDAPVKIQVFVTPT